MRGDRETAEFIPVRHDYSGFLGTFSDREHHTSTNGLAFVKPAKWQGRNPLIPLSRVLSQLTKYNFSPSGVSSYMEE